MQLFSPPSFTNKEGTDNYVSILNKLSQLYDSTLFHLNSFHIMSGGARGADRVHRNSLR